MKKSLVLAAVMGLLSAVPAMSQEKPFPEGEAPEASARTFPNLTLIYLFSGVRDTGSAANTGTATSFHCSSNTTTRQTVRFSIRQWNGPVVAERNFIIEPFGTVTTSTHRTTAYFDDIVLSPGVVLFQGRASILATSPHIYCNAVVINAASASPDGISLTGARFNSIPGVAH